MRDYTANMLAAGRSAIFAQSLARADYARQCRRENARRADENNPLDLPDRPAAGNLADKLRHARQVLGL